MRKFDLRELRAFGHEQREKNVLYERPGLKVRVIGLEPGGKIPDCVMGSDVIFICFEGGVKVTADGRKTALMAGQLAVGGPGVYSMKADSGARLLGIQVAPPGPGRQRRR